MKQEWFEMKDVRKRYFANAVWVPLRAVHKIESKERYGYLGYKEEFFGAGSLAVPLEKKDKAEKLGWMDVGIIHEHSAYVQDGRYMPPDLYEDFQEEFTGIHLLLVQRGNSEEHNVWHLHQDLVIALRLKRENDVWVSPDEGYIEVAHLKRRDDGSAYLLEIRAEHLKDYLCARNMALYITSYRNREQIVSDASHINWAENPLCETTKANRWRGRVSEIHEGGTPYGAETAVFHVSRTDVDPEEDVPSFSLPTNDNVVSGSWTKKDKRRKLYRIQGEFWRHEWVGPAERSPRIRQDKLSSKVFFITDSSGSRETEETLNGGGRWLWFRPDAIMVLAHRRGGSLRWYTRDTGGVKCSPDYDVYFGINRLGLINVYAKDIALLPEWQQRIWAGYNVSPDGKVSEELLASQVKATPANTKAPEAFLNKAIELLNHITHEKYGFNLFREHKQTSQLLSNCHRFRSQSRDLQFELYLAAIFDLSGFYISVDEPDFTFKFEEVTYSIAAKRINSEKKIHARFSKAKKQIKTSGINGFIAFSLDRVVWDRMRKDAYIITDNPDTLYEAGQTILHNILKTKFKKAAWANRDPLVVGHIASLTIPAILPRIISFGFSSNQLFIPSFDLSEDSETYEHIKEIPKKIKWPIHKGEIKT